MHEIEYLEQNEKTPDVKAVLTGLANEMSKHYSNCHSGLYNPIRWLTPICKDYSEAYEAIEQADDGDYDNVAIRYKDGAEVIWLLKIEYHT